MVQQITVQQVEAAIEHAVKLDNTYYLNAGYRRVARQAFKKAAFAWQALDQMVDAAPYKVLRSVDAKYETHVKEAMHRLWNKGGA